MRLDEYLNGHQMLPKGEPLGLWQFFSKTPFWGHGRETKRGCAPGTQPPEFSEKVFQVELGHKKMAEREGFEPSVPRFSGTRDFQSRSFGQLGHLSAPFYILCKRAELSMLAERVGFEPTCPVTHGTSRFRVDPVTTTSVPLHRKVSPLFPEKILYQKTAFLLQDP